MSPEDRVKGAYAIAIEAVAVSEGLTPVVRSHHVRPRDLVLVPLLR